MKMLYNIAKNEYETEDDDGKHRLVYAYFWLAIYFGQCLEETFSIMLWTDRIFKKKVSTNKEVNEIISSIENSKKTMGGFIKQVQQSYSLTVAIVEKLDKILETRNYLVHEYFKLNISKCYSEIGQLEMIKYFCDFIDDSKKLDEELKIYYAGYQAKFHIAEEKIEQLMSEMKAQELARVAEKWVK